MRLALVQPLAHSGADEARNCDDAVAQVAAAAAAGAEVVVFPETYPGPRSTPVAFDPEPRLLEAAGQHGVYVVYGTIEPLAEQPRSAYNLVCIASPRGERELAYRRTHPEGPWIYADGGTWDFDYVAGEELPVLATELGTFACAMCSEVYVPELTRTLALRGAEVIFVPAGDDKQALYETWRTLIWARAIENLAVVVTTQNLFAGERGLAMVATPERVVFESDAPGLHLVELDLERVRELRGGADATGSGAVNGTKAGLLTQWRRPELYAPVSERAHAPV